MDRNLVRKTMFYNLQNALIKSSGYILAPIFFIFYGCNGGPINEMVSKSVFKEINDSLSVFYFTDSKGNTTDSMTFLNGKPSGLSFVTKHGEKTYTTFVNGIKNGPAWKLDQNNKLKVKCQFIDDLMNGDYFDYENGKLTKYSFIINGKKKFIIFYENEIPYDIWGDPLISAPYSIIERNPDYTSFEFNLNFSLPPNSLIDVIVRYPQPYRERTIFIEGLSKGFFYYKDSLPTMPNYNFEIEYYLLDTVNKLTIYEGKRDWIWDNIKVDSTNSGVII